MSQSKLYVGNMSFNTTESELESAFGEFGQVQSVSIVTDRDTGRSRGFAFVEMASPEEAEAAIEGMNGRDLGGRSLTVNLARPREDRGGGGGGGGRGGYGGGGGGGGRGRGGYGGSGGGGGGYGGGGSGGYGGGGGGRGGYGGGGGGYGGGGGGDSYGGGGGGRRRD